MRVEEEGDSSYGLEVSIAVRCGREASALAAAKIAGAPSFSSLLEFAPASPALPACRSRGRCGC